MKLPVDTKPLLQGAAAGAIAMAIIGFTWAGWTTAGKAETMAQSRSEEAVVAALAPVCVTRFEAAPEAAANRSALMKIDSWSRGEFVEKGGWAALGSGATPARITAVAHACGQLLAPA